MTTLLMLAALILFLLGVYGLLTNKHLIKLVICFNIMEAAVLIFLVALGHRQGAGVPIVRPEGGPYVDPLPHALALTAIVIGASLTAMMLSYIIKLYQRYRTVDVDRLKRLRG